MSQQTETLKVPNATDAAASFTGAASKAADGFERGVNRSTKWHTAVTAPGFVDAWVNGVSKEESKRKLAKDIAAVSQADYQSKTVTKGKPALRAGIAGAGSKYQAGLARVNIPVLQNLQVPKRIKGDANANVMNRSLALAVALEKKKKELLGTR